MHADLDTLQKVRVVLAKAMADGADPAEALDRAGLLWFEDRERVFKARTLRGVSEVLGQMNIRELARSVEDRMPTSTLDAKRQIVAWLEKLATS